MRSLLQKARDHLLAVKGIKKSPHAIASGFAIGTFIGILPTPGFSILLGVAISLIFKRVSKVALFAALIIWNPFLIIPISVLSYKIGDALFTGAAVVSYELSAWDMAFHITRRYLIGNVIMATVLSIVSYALVRVSAQVIQNRSRPGSQAA